jgi:hypothetical protein
VLNPFDPIFVKIQLFIAVLVLLLSLILRKYFYISLKAPEHTIPASYTTKKTQEKTEKKYEDQQQNDNDEIKIYIDKEIK